LTPTYYGYIGSTKDALLIIQATLNNQLLAVPRRPHEKERSSLIRSGNIFVFIEERSGIKRWTDGIAWSPSRILGRFLVYRELDRSALSDKEDSKARKKRKKSPTYGNEAGGSSSSTTNELYNTASNGNVPNRELVGSLVASYAFKDRGLIKKTLSITIHHPKSHHQQPISEALPPSNSETIHIVSYYSAEDVMNGQLKRPIDSPNLKDLQ
ncbi:hypothetical protein PACTADRAFT_20429, partial [Pachysolen tannophilus NRRL Y-2460]